MMSDLLPLVAEALKEKVLYDAKEEVEELQQQLKLARKVEVIHQVDNDEDQPFPDSVVYASADLADGCFHHNPIFWQVEFAPTSTCCSVSDLRSVRICVGGGFPILTFDPQKSQPSAGVFDYHDEDSDTSKGISFCFNRPDVYWVDVVIRGWPRESWENSPHIVDAELAVKYLLEEVAVQFPDATVEFKDLLQMENVIHGGLKRWVPKERLEAARADRDAQLVNETD